MIFTTIALVLSTLSVPTIARGNSQVGLGVLREKACFRTADIDTGRLSRLQYYVVSHSSGGWIQVRHLRAPGNSEVVTSYINSSNLLMIHPQADTVCTRLEPNR
jgi:hypothetical protein